jgi:hypothetical protein
MSRAAHASRARRYAVIVDEAHSSQSLNGRTSPWDAKQNPIEAAISTEVGDNFVHKAPPAHLVGRFRVLRAVAQNKGKSSNQLSYLGYFPTKVQTRVTDM